MTCSFVEGSMKNQSNNNLKMYSKNTHTKDDLFLLKKTHRKWAACCSFFVRMMMMMMMMMVIGLYTTSTSLASFNSVHYFPSKKEFGPLNPK